MGASALICIDRLSIASRSRGCKRGQGNFLHFGRFDKFFRQNWAKWRKIRALSRPWPPLGGGCRRSRLGERNPYGVSPSVALRATPPSQREANGRGRAPPLRAVLRKCLRKSSLSVALRATPPSQREARKKSRRGRFFFCFFHHSHHFSGRVTVTVVPSPSQLVRDTVPWW